MLLAMLLAATTASSTAALPVPPTEKKPVTDTYPDGGKVVDDYRWLEDGDAPAVQKWIEAQNAYAESVLRTVPQRAALEARVRALESSSSSRYTDLTQSTGVLFAVKHQPPKQQAFLVALKGADDPKSERVVVDPNVLDPTGNTAIDFFEPSKDGKLIAVSLSLNGTEDGSVHVYDAATGKARPDVVPGVNGGTAGGGLTWNADGTGFWYTRYPRGTERAAADMAFFQQVWFHALGTKTEDDVYAIGKDFPRIALVSLESDKKGNVLAQAANGDGGEFEHHLLPAGAKEWIRLTTFADRVIEAHFAEDGGGAIWMLSRKDAARGKLLRMPLATPSLASAKEVVPASEGTISHWEVTGAKLFVVDLLGGPSQVRVFGLDKDGKAKSQAPLAILPVSAVGALVHTKGDEILFLNESWLEPPAWFRADAKGKISKTKLATTSPASYRDSEVVRELATSKDGTKIPLNILRRKGTKLDGKNPTILYAYGGYGVSLTPKFSSFYRVWLDQGGVYVIANLRGGGEFGDEWHLSGNLTKKQNVFDDYEASARHLVEKGYATPATLAAYGRSNGGLLMGAAITQYPQHFKAVVAAVGIYDMLRVELHSNGAFNVTEFGSVKDPAQLKALRAYSPVHNVKDGTAYPAAFFFTGANDPRVDPYQSRKMAARLQAASSSSAPTLVKTTKGGHGGGGTGSLDQRIEEEVGIYSFLFGQLGVEYKRPSL